MMMLDTIVLTLPEKDFLIKNEDRFTPYAGFLKKHMYSNSNMLKAVYNPTNIEKCSEYKPRLTLIRKPFTEKANAIFLRIEFSAPKLLYGNNFVELHGYRDFEPVLTRLHTVLASMGIEMSLETLRMANVLAIHYSKNILLDKYTPCYILLRELEKLDLSTKLDLTHTDFRNCGQMVKYHANTYEVALYDKVKDLQQAYLYGDARSAETHNSHQMDLLNTLGLPEVLRFEVRLKLRKLKSILQKISFDKPINFESLFSVNISRAILLEFWSLITKDLYMLNLNTKYPADMIEQMKLVFPRKQPASILQLLGFLYAVDNLGIRGARLSLSLRNHAFYRLKKDLKALNATHTNPRFSILKAVKEQIAEFVPLVAEDLVKAD